VTKRKITYNSKTRMDFSNEFHRYSHDQLLVLANVQKFNGNYEVKKLPDGRIKVEATNKKKKK